MPNGLAELIQGIGPLGAFCLALIYLLMRDRKNSRRAGANPGAWQAEMKAAQEKTNDTLERIEAGMKEAVHLLMLMEDRQKREGT